MRYCENCNFVCNEERCPVCGSKRLRDVNNDDFCLLIERGAHYCDMLTQIFDAHDIQYSAVPYGSGVETEFGLPLSNYRLYVPFCKLEEAKRIISETERAETDKIRKELLQNANEFYVQKKVEKKVRKKMKLPDDIDFFDYCIEIIETADRIVDGGKITGDLKGAHYYFCYATNIILTFNSVTYEILSVTKEK